MCVYIYIYIYIYFKTDIQIQNWTQRSKILFMFFYATRLNMILFRPKYVATLQELQLPVDLMAIYFSSYKQSVLLKVLVYTWTPYVLKVDPL